MAGQTPARTSRQPDIHAVETVTPTGHVYTSIAPQVRIVRRPVSMELYLARDSQTS